MDADEPKKSSTKSMDDESEAAKQAAELERLAAERAAYDLKTDFNVNFDAGM